jgi:hypothetical protein
MANFGWAYVNCEDTSSGNASIYGPTGSILFLTGSQAASGSTRLVYYTASAAAEHPYSDSTLVLTGTLIISGAISASTYHIEDIAIIDATGSTYFGDDQTDIHARTGSLELYNDSALYFKATSATGELTGSGTLTLGDALSVTANVSGSGVGTFAAGLVTEGALNVSGALTVGGNSSLGDAVTDVATVTGHLTASNGVDVSGLANFNSSVILANEASDTVTVHGYLSSSAAATIKGNIVGEADLRITGSSDPAGSLIYDGVLLNVTGDLTASAGVSASYFLGDGAALTGLLSTDGSGVDNRVAVFTGADTLQGNPDFIFDGTKVALGGTVTTSLSASGELEIVGHARLGYTLGVTGNADFGAAVDIDTTLTVDGISGLDGGITIGIPEARKLVVSTAGDIHAQGDILSSGSCVFGNQNSDATKATGSLSVYRDSGEQIFGVNPLTYTTTVGGLRGGYQQIVSDLQTASNADYIVGFGTGDAHIAYCVLSASSAGVGSMLTLKDEFTGTRTTGSGIYVSSSGADTIDGQGFYKITGSMASINLYSNGLDKWFIF